MNRCGKRRRTYATYRPRKRRALTNSIHNAIQDTQIRTLRRTLNRRTGGQLGVELKYKDGNNTSTLVDNQWMQITSPMNAVAAGTGANERDGRQILLKGIYSHIEVSSFALEQQYFRIALVLDTQYNSIDNNVNGDTGSQIFLNENGDAGNPTSDFRNLENTSRFKVLYDKTIKLNPMIAGGAPNDILQYQGNRPKVDLKVAKKLNMKVNYKSADGTAPAIVDNALYWIACQTRETAGELNTNIGILVKHRMRFIG